MKNKVTVAYIYKTPKGVMFPATETIINVSDETLEACKAFLETQELIPHNDPVFSKVVEYVPLSLRGMGIVIASVENY